MDHFLDVSIVARDPANGDLGVAVQSNVGWLGCVVGTGGGGDCGDTISPTRLARKGRLIAAGWTAQVRCSISWRWIKTQPKGRCRWLTRLGRRRLSRRGAVIIGPVMGLAKLLAGNIWSSADTLAKWPGLSSLRGFGSDWWLHWPPGSSRRDRGQQCGAAGGADGGRLWRAE
jgi:hypothetical protein